MKIGGLAEEYPGMNELEREKAEAWMGDAVLALFARRWILDTFGRPDGDLQTLITCNHFLSRFGNPTAVEASIGRVLESQGMEAALESVRARFFPEMIRHVRRQRPALAGCLPAQPPRGG